MIAAASSAAVGDPGVAELELLVVLVRVVDVAVVEDDELVVAGELDVLLVVESVDDVEVVGVDVALVGAVVCAVVGTVADPLVTGGATAVRVEGVGTVVVADPFVADVPAADVPGVVFFPAEVVGPEAGGAGAFVDDPAPVPGSAEVDDPGGAAAAPSRVLRWVSRKTTKAAAASTSARMMPRSAPTGRRRSAGSTVSNGRRGPASSDSAIAGWSAEFPANCPVHSRVDGLPGRSRTGVGGSGMVVEGGASGVRTGSC